MSVSNQKYLQNLKESSVTSIESGCKSFKEDSYIIQIRGLEAGNLIALMTMKFNAKNDCYESFFSDELLIKCKKAKYLAVKDSWKPADNDDNLEDETTRR